VHPFHRKVTIEKQEKSNDRQFIDAFDRCEPGQTVSVYQAWSGGASSKTAVSRSPRRRLDFSVGEVHKTGS
jgi:ribosomal protein S7